MLAWVTGASSGIGRATALELSSRGHIVLASARRGEELESLSAEGSRIIPLPLDVTDFAACKALIEKAEKKYGPIELAILNAGIYQPDPVVKLDRALVDKHFDVNVFGVVNCLYAVLDGMLVRKRGHIALCASVAGYRGLPNSFSYGATKAALINMAECLKLELEPHKIRVQVINPGFVKTPATAQNTFKMPGLISAEEAAKEIVRGLNMSEFEIRFPAGFTWFMSVLRIIPDWLYFPIISKMTRGK
jgi:NADP-dependent 3-hydroxy acid dehydrogenase YdfG